MSLSKYRSKVDRITQSVRNLAVRHNFYFQIIGSFLILLGSGSGAKKWPRMKKKFIELENGAEAGGPGQQGEKGKNRV